MQGGMGGRQRRANPRQHQRAERMERRQAHAARQLDLVMGDAALELLDRVAHQRRQGHHVLARRGRPIARAFALEQPDAEPRLHRREPAKERGMVEPKPLGRAAQRLRLGDRPDDAKFVPVERLGHRCSVRWRGARRGGAAQAIVDGGAEPALGDRRDENRRRPGRVERPEMREQMGRRLLEVPGGG